MKKKKEAQNKQNEQTNNIGKPFFSIQFKIDSIWQISLMQKWPLYFMYSTNSELIQT